MHRSDSREKIYEKLCEVENDKEFKMYLLKKIDTIEENNRKLDKNFAIFKVKAYVFMALIIGLKDTLVKKLIG